MRASPTPASLLGILAVMLALALLSPRAQGAGQDVDALLEQALTHYRQAQGLVDRDARLAAFGRAAELFVEAARRGVHSPDVHANAGTAALQAERHGMAVLELRRALALDPDHERATRNLRQARALMPDWLPQPDAPQGAASFFAWHALLSTAEHIGLAAALFLAGSALLALGLARGTAVPRWIGLTLGAAWLAVLASAYAGNARGADDAVLMVESVARAADSVNAPPRFTRPLPAGAEFNVVEERAGWARVRLSGHRDAWLRSSAFEHVRPPA